MNEELSPQKPEAGSFSNAWCLLSEKRARRLLLRLSTGEGLPDLAVTRAEIFLTEKCNMSCEDCQSVTHKMPGWKGTEVLDLLNRLASTGTQHVQWTGGEAGLHPLLPYFVQFSSARGMVNSISTNGALTPEFYLKLVNAGMKGFQLSMDAFGLDKVSRSKGGSYQAIDVLNTLCHARDKGANIHIIANVSLSPEDLQEMMKGNGDAARRFLSWFVTCCVEDFKIVYNSDQPLRNAFPNQRMYEKFLSICKMIVPKRFTMFHHRLASLQENRPGMSRSCYVSMDDRTYDTLGAYACMAQLKEGAAPIYLHSDSEEQKRKKLKAFLAEDRTQDPICMRSCFDLHQAINSQVNELV